MIRISETMSRIVVLVPFGSAIPLATEVMIPKKGTWHVYARTWNWCSPWKMKEAPGRFKIAVNGAVLDNELGMGTQWDWEYAGSVEIKNKSNSVTLKDLTGFEGCDPFYKGQKCRYP